MITLKINKNECETSAHGPAFTIVAEAVVGVEGLIRTTARAMGIPQSVARDMLFHVADASGITEESNSDD